jgi:phosphoribosyl-AMP cyclohydrolase / phosphoribosyl-ATP pyrophosphohydrolase
MSYLDTLRWNADGLVPAVAQAADSGRVLTLAWMNRAALSATVASGHAHYWSRSRQRLWKKGESSGHVQAVRELRLDCDSDTVLLIVDQAGGIACHTGHERCFFKRLEEGEWKDVEPVVKDPKAIYPNQGTGVRSQESDSPEVAVRHDGDMLAILAATIESRKGADPKLSYVASLLSGGDDPVLKKIGEEATETVLAAKEGDPARITQEVADLWFHCLVMLARHGLSPADVLAELARRHGTSGIEEKSARTRPD